MKILGLDALVDSTLLFARIHAKQKSRALRGLFVVYLGNQCLVLSFPMLLLFVFVLIFVFFLVFIFVLAFVFLYIFLSIVTYRIPGLLVPEVYIADFTVGINGEHFWVWSCLRPATLLQLLYAAFAVDEAYERVPAV